MHLAEAGGESEILEVNSSLERLSTVDSDRDSSDDLGLLSRLPPGSLGFHESSVSKEKNDWKSEAGNLFLGFKKKLKNSKFKIQNLKI